MITTIGTAELIEIIKAKDINFIATAITPLHAHGVDCCYQKLTDDGVEVRGIVLIYKHRDSGFVIDKSHFINQDCIIYYYEPVYSQSIGSLLSNLKFLYYSPTKIARNKRYNKDIYIASAWQINIGIIHSLRLLDHKIYPRFMIFEEGLATYFPCEQSFSRMWYNTNRNRNSNGLKRIVAFTYNLAIKKLKSRAITKIPFQNLNLLLDNNGKLNVNNEATVYYNRVIHMRESHSNNNFSMFENSVVICTMAYPRTHTNKETDIKLLNMLIFTVRESGYKVILKPHPREIDCDEYYSSLECEILNDRTMSMEQIMANAKDLRAVISFSSTALVTAKLLFGIKAISILDLLYLNNYSEYVQDEMSSFTNVFGGLIDVPKTLDEFRIILIS